MINDEYTDTEIDQMIDDIFEPGEDKQLRRVVCTHCGKIFETEKPHSKVCPDCRREVQRANNAKKKTAQIKTAEAPPPDPAPKAVAAQSAEPIVLTIGRLAKLLSGDLDSAEITVDGQRVREIRVQHVYNLASGSEQYRVDFKI